MARCAVLGSPVAHSLSPVMHRAAYAELGLADWCYSAIDVGEQDFAGFVQDLDSTWRGLSVTAPLKHAAAHAATWRDAAVERTAVANTLVFENGERRAYNTDITGAVAALRERGIDRPARVAILGAGATARSVGEAAIAMGAGRLYVLARRWDAAQALARDLAGAVEVESRGLDGELPRVDLLISTVPSSATAARAASDADRAGAVFDVLYDPWPTPLARAAEHRGISVISGLDLLAHQAALQVHLMTGRTVSAGLLRAAALAELERRG